MKRVLIRIFAVPALAGLLAAPSFSQITFKSGPNGLDMRDPLAGVKQALNLTDSQVSQLQGLLESQLSALQPLLDDVAAKDAAFQNALQGGDATTVGNVALALQSSKKALNAAQDANREALLGVLTAAQKQIVNDYLKIAQNGGLGPFEMLLGGGPGAVVINTGGLHMSGSIRHILGPRPF